MDFWYVFTVLARSDLDEVVLDHVETTWHSLGTCAMKPREEGGVVDARLNVYGKIFLLAYTVFPFYLIILPQALKT